MKKRIGCILFGLFVVLYVCAFCFSRNWAKKPIIKYYEKNETILYDGVEYTFDAELLDEKELVDKYDVPEEILASTVYCKEFNVFKYIIIKVKMKRVAESQLNQSYSNVLSKYIQAGGWDDVKNFLEGDNRISSRELEMGQEAECYQVNILNKSYENDKLKFDEQTFYIEFKDYEGHEYLERVRILN